MSACSINGIDVTLAFTTTSCWDDPRMYYMHVPGAGKPADPRAQGKPATMLIWKGREPAGRRAGASRWRSGDDDIDTAKLAQIVGPPGEQSRRLQYQESARRNLKLTEWARPQRADGLITWAAFCRTNENAVASLADVAILATEVKPVCSRRLRQERSTRVVRTSTHHRGGGGEKKTGTQPTF